MKWFIVMLTAVTFMGGCDPASPRDDHAFNSKIVTRTGDLSIRSAIISQHTLYPYHFIEGSARLNELGVQDSMILASHYKDYPCDLSVRQGGAPKPLYEARVAAVLEFLSRAGVDTARMSIVDAQPGGDGMVSERVIRILQKDAQSGTATTTPPATGTVGTVGGVSPVGF